MPMPKFLKKSFWLPKIKRVVKDYLFWTLLPRKYQRAADECAAETVLFIDTKETNIPYAMQYIYERIQANYDYEVEFVSLMQNESRFIVYMRHCVDALGAVARARYIFLSDASDYISCLPLREETKVVQLWHGSGAFKKWGFSTAEAIFGGSREEKERHPYYENLDLVCVSSPEVIWAYEEAMGLEGRGIVQPTGVAASDVFFDQAFLDNARKSIEGAIPEIANKKIVLYAPTFRGRVKHAKAPDALDIGLFVRELGEDYVLLVKNHPFVRDELLLDPANEGFVFDITHDSRIAYAQVLAAADVLITDYSSVVFDFCLLNRPMCFFAYDIEDYNDWRGFYYNYDEMTPGPIFTETEQIIGWIHNLPEAYDAEEMRAFREKFMQSCDGRSTSRILDFMFNEAVTADQGGKPDATGNKA